MAQYPQGIFQSLQWLLKKVKILALDKQPIYNIGVVANGVSYNILGRGYYNCTGTIGTGNLKFPNPALMQGQTITLYTVGVATIDSTYAPFVSATPLTSTALAASYSFISDGTKWVATSFV
jgi:hypothetical protein